MTKMRKAWAMTSEAIGSDLKLIKDSWLQWRWLRSIRPTGYIQILWRSWNDPCSLQRWGFKPCKEVPISKHFRNTRLFNCTFWKKLKKWVHAHCLSLSSSLPSTFLVQESSVTESVNLLFTSINKIRYKLLQYKLPCSGPLLTSAINDKDPSFSQFLESPISRTKFKPANVLEKSCVNFSDGCAVHTLLRAWGPMPVTWGTDAAGPTFGGCPRHLQL